MVETDHVVVEVETEHVVVEVETAKAAVEVPCLYAGRVAALHAEPGAVDPVGDPLISIEPVAAEQKPAQEPAGHATYREEERAGSGSVLGGYGTGPAPRPPATPSRSRAPAGAGPPAGAGQPACPGERRNRTQPAVRRPGHLTDHAPPRRRPRHRPQADQAHWPWRSDPPLRHRVAVIVSRAGVAATPPTSAPEETRIPDARTEACGRREGDTVPSRDPRRHHLGRRRRHRAARAPQSAERRVPRPHHQRLALVARFCLAALRRYPELNSRVEGDEIVQSSAVHLGFVAQTDRGLVVPVIKNASSLTTLGFPDALAETTAQAREATLPPNA